MRVLFGICFIVSVFVFVGCGSSAAPSPESALPRSVKVATSRADVVNAWDIHCSSCNFDACPAGVLMTPYTQEDLGDLYNGSSFASDSTALMEAIQDEVQSALMPDTDIDDLLHVVLDAPEWYQ
ncbi:hypothetical protein KDL44_06425 [bacterium]|nr:hypothetical protein [bacterium]